MNIFKQYINYLEAKEAIIKRQSWTPEQKSEIQELVNKYPQKASKVSWQQKDLDAESVLNILKTESKKEVKKQIRSGFAGLVENEDYVEIPSPSSKILHIYVPLTHKGSCAIGRDSKWCTSMESNNKFWQNYKDKDVKFFYLFSTLPQPNDMIAVSVEKTGKSEVYNQVIMWNKFDDVVEPNPFTVSRSWFSEKAKEIEYPISFFDAIKQNDIQVVKEFLKKVDPSAEYNYAIKEAAIRGHTEIVKLLLADKRVDPSDSDNYAFRIAVNKGLTKVVKLLLADKRVDPNCHSGFAIKTASEYRYDDIVKLLLADKRIRFSDIEDAIRVQSTYNHASDMVKLLKSHPKLQKRLKENND